MKVTPSTELAESCHRPITVGPAGAAVDPNAIPGSVCVRVSKGEDLPQVESKQDPYVHMALATSHGASIVFEVLRRTFTLIFACGCHDQKPKRDPTLNEKLDY